MDIAAVNTQNCHDIALIGGGFAGLMLVTHLVHLLDGHRSIVWFEPAPYLPRGVAYSTPRQEHILNVCANNMGAFADDAAHFYTWLLGRQHQVRATQFVSRGLYGDYLEDIWHHTQQHAQEKNIHITIQREKATSLYAGDAGWHINTQSAKVVVLASGNPFEEPTADDVMVSAPRLYPYQTLSTVSPHLPVVIIGTGLTAIDTINSIQRAHPQRNIICVSRTGLFPRPHLDFETQETFDKYALSAQWKVPQSPVRLSALMRLIRAEVVLAASKGYTWQQVLDAIRPLTPQLWQHLLPADQKRFLRRYATLWNVHRHRMPAAGYAHLQTLQHHQQLSIRQAGLQRVALSADKTVMVHLTKGDPIHAAVVFDCMGPRYSTLNDGLLQQVLQQGDVHSAACGYGLKQINYRVSMPEKPPLYAVGALLLGDLLETVAVPELRGQCLRVAQQVAAHFNAVL